MCKIMVMAGVNNTNRKLAWEFTKQMAMQLSPGNNDGLGYAAVTSDGELFGERWHINSEAFAVRPAADIPSQEEIKIVRSFDGVLTHTQKPVRYNKFGSINEDAMVGITLHTRMATSGKQFINTHPFVRGKTSLIHNGVIGNADKLELIQSTCDSEVILNLYVKHNVSNNMQAIQKVAHKLSGYYACGVITESKQFGPVVDIFKDDRARLSAAFIRDMGIVVFSTVMDDIETVCNKMGMEIAYKFGVNSGMLLRLSALSGAPVAVQKFRADYKSNDRKEKGPAWKFETDGTYVEDETSWHSVNSLRAWKRS